jgi:hypothetical protein
MAPRPLEPAVGMLDCSDRTLHRCSEFHLVTACGLRPAIATVGPWAVVHERSRRLCMDCWGCDAVT